MFGGAVHPADHDTRDAMRQKAMEAADHLKIDSNLIEFRWLDHLEGAVNLHPNLIPVHLPGIAATLSYVLSLDEWGREQRLRDQWVDFGGPRRGSSGRKSSAGTGPTKRAACRRIVRHW